jgi:hypothetical protein
MRPVVEGPRTGGAEDLEERREKPGVEEAAPGPEVEDPIDEPGEVLPAPPLFKNPGALLNFRVRLGARGPCGGGMIPAAEW